jgi:hypothetical protein
MLYRKARAIFGWSFQKFRERKEDLLHVFIRQLTRSIASVQNRCIIALPFAFAKTEKTKKKMPKKHGVQLTTLQFVGIWPSPPVSPLMPPILTEPGDEQAHVEGLLGNKRGRDVVGGEGLVGGEHALVGQQRPEVPGVERVRATGVRVRPICAASPDAVAALMDGS